MPDRNRDDVSTAKNRAPSPAERPSSATVLVVDHEADIRYSVGLWLRASGFQVRDASSVQQALKALNDQPFDAVVLDIWMPGRNGFELLAELQQPVHARRATIVLSASVADREQALDAGADCFLSKPYQGPQLTATVRSVLAAKRQAFFRNTGPVAGEPAHRAARRRKAVRRRSRQRGKKPNRSLRARGSSRGIVARSPHSSNAPRKLPRRSELSTDLAPERDPHDTQIHRDRR